MVLFICCCGFELPSGIIPIVQDNFAPIHLLCAISKHIHYIPIVLCSYFKISSRRKGKKYLFILCFIMCNYLYWCFLFSHVDLYYHLRSPCFLHEKLPLVFLLKYSSNKFSPFLFTGECFYLTSFFKDIFPGYRILSWHCFSLYTLNMLFCCFCPPLFLIRSWLLIFLGFPCKWWVIFLLCAKFSHYLWLLPYICLWTFSCLSYLDVTEPPSKSTA